MCVPTLAASPLCTISGIISSSPCASVCLHFLMKYNTNVSVVGRSLFWPKKLTFNVLLLYSLAGVLYTCTASPNTSYKLEGNTTF